MAVDVKSLEGNEIADDYVRTAGTEGRMAATWNVIKKAFGKLVLLNILMLIFFAPAIAVLMVRNYVINFTAGQAPFNANTGIGYPANINAAGLSESIYFSTDLVFFALLIACGIIAAIGLSGGAYCIKKLLNTEGTQFSFKGFAIGIKTGYVKTVIPVVLFLVFYFCTVITGDWKDLVIAQGGSGAGPITAYVFVIIATVLAGLYLAWTFATGVSYRIKFSKVLKISLQLFTRSIIQTVVLAAIALIPVWLYLIGTAVSIIIFIAYAILILFGISFIILIWMSFTQWIFDMNVAPKIVKQEESKSKSVKAVEEPKDEKDVARELLASGRSELIAKPILPIAEKTAVSPLGQTFTRADVGRVNVEREKLKGEISAYENAHKNEKIYAEYNKLFAEREKALQPETGKRGKKKKKISASNLLK